MSIEYGDKSKIEQQKIEQKESDKPKTGKEALDFLKQQKMEDKKEAKESRETPEFRQESLSGKQSLAEVLNLVTKLHIISSDVRINRRRGRSCKILSIQWT